MPEMTFDIEWPDGRKAQCYSPSLIVHDYLKSGQSYPLADFMQRTGEALEIASERVRAKYGFACSRAMDQLAELQAEAAQQASDGVVRVLALHPEPPQ